MDRKKIARIAVAAILLAIAIAVEHTVHLQVWQLLLIYLVPFVYIGHDVVAEAVEGLFHGHAFNEEMLMTIATIGALCIGFLPGASTEFPEAVFVMLFFQVGELFEDYAEDRSRAGVSSLMDLRPDTTCVVRNGTTLAVHPSEVMPGETVVVKPGERIPLDGRIVEGHSSLDTSALTGESMPRDVAEGDDAVSGCINLSGLLKIETTKPFGESTASRIIDLVENASAAKSKSETFIARFARIYTPAVVAAAVLTAFVPPLFSDSYTAALATWLQRALMFLVVSCPCALVVSVPLAFFGGIGGASRRGILVKGSCYMETLARTGTIVFDKTGTLTRGRFEVCAVHPTKLDADALLHLASHVEHYSTHPIAAALRDAFKGECPGCSVENVEEIAGHGARARVGGHDVCVGNPRLMDAVGAAWHDCHRTGTVVHVAVDGEYAGHIVVNDSVKADAAQCIAALKGMSVKRTVMLTGDRRDTAAEVAQSLGLDEWHAELLPADKVSRVEELLRETPRGKSLAFAGDGINDAPVLARADVGIAMGAMGSDAAIEAADVVIMDDKPSRIADAIAIARHTVGIARQNTAFALTVKFAVLGLAGAGMCTMWLAVFADVGVTVIAVLNSLRTLRA